MVHRWGFVAPAREENRCKFMPRFACVSRTSFSYSPAGEFVAGCVLIRAIVGSRAKIDSRVALIRFARVDGVRDSGERGLTLFSFSEYYSVTYISFEQTKISKDVDDDQTVVDALYRDTLCRDGFSCSRGGYRHRDANGKTRSQRRK